MNDQPAPPTARELAEQVLAAVVPLTYPEEARLARAYLDLVTCEQLKRERDALEEELARAENSRDDWKLDADTYERQVRELREALALCNADDLRLSGCACTPTEKCYLHGRIVGPLLAATEEAPDVDLQDLTDAFREVLGYVKAHRTVEGGAPEELGWAIRNFNDVAERLAATEGEATETDEDPQVLVDGKWTSDPGSINAEGEAT
jgi:chromosome segregation ATPase